MNRDLAYRLRDEADQCRQDGVSDIAGLLDEAATALMAMAYVGDLMRARDWSLRTPREVADIVADAIEAALESPQPAGPTR